MSRKSGPRYKSGGPAVDVECLGVARHITSQSCQQAVCRSQVSRANTWKLIFAKPRVREIETEKIGWRNARVCRSSRVVVCTDPILFKLEPPPNRVRSTRPGRIVVQIEGFRA